MRSVYVTGTDTGIGKTQAAVALLHGLRARGIDAVGMKPVASGCDVTAQGLRNDDARALLAAGPPDVDYATINPCALREPTAPEIAAAIDGVDVSLQPLEHAFRVLASRHRMVVVEGVGGWLAPLSASLMQADLVRRLQLPVLLVVGVRLGCINHALLSERALREDGATLLGWIGNRIDPGMEFAEETLAILRSRLSLPCLGVLPFGSTPQQGGAALDIDRLG